MCVVVFFSHSVFLSRSCYHSQFSENPDNQSLSVLTFTPAIDDDGKHLSCRSSNPHIKDSTIEDKWQLVVHCKLMNHYIVVDIWFIFGGNFKLFCSNRLLLCMCATVVQHLFRLIFGNWHCHVHGICGGKKSSIIGRIPHSFESVL